MTLIDRKAVDQRLTDICDRYEKTAPTVHAWADELYIRLSQSPDSVLLVEIYMLDHLYNGGNWLQHNAAANMLYHLLHRLGRDTTGMAGF